ncbi:Sigma-W factor [Salinivirga cyanobacteriivorans]|uniref:Sigma-W factor n=1 Tax=Salinivirga cyanobacteriivorans TaxID=1307839 RepID=A0A0S2HWV1_9BACT|nr:sigma-70 family RNA polymerase sigma factor [Salinivirga cyanobacteriivorans]ALO14567.1 Sigma-W factor [Salinivirga cyanobacteriivorans]
MNINEDFSPKAKEDLLLVRRAQKGDELAFAELMKRYRDSIYYLLLKMVNNAVDAEDLTIEAFGKAFRNIDRYSPSYAFSTWLFKIASNNCIDFLRKNKGREYAFQANSEDISQTGSNDEYSAHVQLESKNPMPDELMMTDEKAKALRKVVRELKPRYKKLVELRYFKEYSYEEISQELEIPLGTVKAQLFRARELLFNILKDKHKNL